MNTHNRKPPDRKRNSPRTGAPPCWLDRLYFLLLKPWILALALGVVLVPSEILVGELKSGFRHLNIGVGARAAGMGNAFTGVSNDATALYWNVSGLGGLRRREFSAMHGEWLLGSQFQFLGYAQPTAVGTIAFGASSLRQPDQEGRGESREQAGSFGAQDSAFTLGFATQLGAQNQLGVGLKYLQSQIGQDRGQGVAMDVGAMRHLISIPVSVGASVRNLGPGIRFQSETTQLPLTVALGSAFYLVPGLALAADVAYSPYDEKVSVGFGTEYRILAMLALRGGYLSSLASVGGRGSGPLGDLQGLGAGVGLRLGSYQIDYAMTPFGELGNTQRVSLGARF